MRLTLISESSSKPHDVPDVRQSYAYDCGAAAFQTVCGFYDISGDDEDAFRDTLDSNDKDGTRPPSMLKLAKVLDLKATEFRDDGSFARLKSHLKKGPVICAIQQGGRKYNRDKEQEGHYVVVRGLTDEHVLIQNPTRGRHTLTRKAFMDRWHDRETDGTHLVRWGLLLQPVDSKV